VRRCIDIVPDNVRRVIVLRDIQELDSDETGVTLRIAAGAVKTRLHRARRALRKMLKPHFV
jgi:RNA polymerase sigma-70 factor (ECF subfamily)